MEYASGSESAAANGDYVGVESCIDLRNEEEFKEYVKDCERSYDRRKLQRQREKVEVAAAVIGDAGRRRMTDVRVFPPPITILARTENQPSHMPWVMKRYYTDDGRLVIKEEKVTNRDYFRANRADGRLTLQLIPLADHNFDDLVAAQLNNTDIKFVNDAKDTEVMNEKTKEDEEVVARVVVTSMSMAALCITEGVKSCEMLTSVSSSSLSGGRKKFYGFNSLRSSSASSLFHLQPPAIWPVFS